MQRKLEQTVEEFRLYSEQASLLFDETVQCLEEMKTQGKLSEDAIAVMFSSTSMEDIQRAINKRPAVVFIGNRNCGKSAILNELLGGSYLPVHETPCTSRIVKISYSPNQNTVRVVDRAGQEVIPLTTFKRKVPKDYVVACDEGRDQIEQLRWSVEVALNHPFLKSGIELIDSPGRNENDALDDVVDSFFEKGTTPLVVYIIDGNEQLRPSDRDTIRFLQDKYPQLSFMFVCNKVDTSAGAETFDARSSDDLDSDDEDISTKSDKQRTVFYQLQHHGLIEEIDSFDTCSCFYGISATNAREDRRKNGTSKATEAFSRFEEGLLAILDETVKRQAKQAVSKLILLQMSIVQAMGRTRQDLSHGRLFGSSLEFDKAKSIGNSIHETLISAIASEKKIGMLVNCNLLNLEEKFMSSAEHYQFHSMGRSKGLEVEARTYYLLLLKEKKSTEQFTYTPTKEDAPFLRFLVVMKGVIMDVTFNVLRRVVEEFLKRTTDHVEIHSVWITNPVLGYAFEVAYGSGLPRRQSTDRSSLAETGVDVLNLLKTMMSNALRKVLTMLLMEGVLHAMEWKSSNANFSLADKQNRRKIMELVFSKFNHDVITKTLCVACTKCLEAVHDAFFKVIDDLSRVNDLVSTNRSQMLQEMAALYVPTVKHLVVRGLALQFLLTKGPLTLGTVLKSTKHGKIYDCYGWANEGYRGACAVKVIEEEKVDAEVWAQTSVDLFHVMEIQARVGKAHRNLLYVHGWLIPEPGVIHVLMEKADSDVTTALQEGLLLKTRMKIALDVASGLKAVHSAQFVHQDIKADSILLTRDGTAKINMARPEKPFERTRQGTPFHISLEMHRNYAKGLGSDCSYDIYAFGVLLWVLCDGSGTRRPQAYERYSTIAAMKLAVEREIYPERPEDSTDACWELMTKCWRQRCVLTADDVLKDMEEMFHCIQ